MNIKEIIGSIFSIAVKVVLVALVSMFIMKWAKEAYSIGYRVFTETPVGTGEGRTVTVTIGENTSSYEVGKKLVEAGLIRDEKVFFLQELASESHGKMKPGKFELNTNMTAEEMIKTMAGVDMMVDETDPLFNADEEGSVGEGMVEMSVDELFGDDGLEDTFDDSEDMDDSGEETE